ncbi:protein PRRC1-B-like isoform X2 [Daktulosphaira vitifoliae]|uniref:protein PRRC1-B-like isoform X2 n=1 Tax=Daktulosphaira vitifoliae TaxID=58002 RepID=UPI0021A9BD69|nr:protein PRRC1-B-like isoform X2 [Daktulosphaira vitifoliae]
MKMEKSNENKISIDQLLSKLPPPTPLPSYVIDALNEGTPELNTSILQLNNMNNQNFHTPTFSPAISNRTETSDITGDVTRKVEEFKDDQGTNGKTDLFNWMRGSGSSIFSMVAEKAKNSVDAVLTTLDPQMKDASNALNFENTDVIIASEKEIVVSAVREGFQKVFGKCNVKGLESPNHPFATQLVGFSAATQATRYCIDAVRLHVPKGPIVAYEKFIVEPTDSKWYEFGLLKLHDLEKNIDLEIYTQSIPVPSSVVRLISDDTPKDYEHLSTGFSIPVAHFMASNLKVHPSEWQEVMTGISNRTLLLNASTSLAMWYKNALE